MIPSSWSMIAVIQLIAGPSDLARQPDDRVARNAHGLRDRFL